MKLFHHILLPLSLMASAAQAQNVNIPDVNFKAYLVGNLAINTNSDTEIDIFEAAAFTGQIMCNNLAITDLTGIEAFTALTDLRCSTNQLTNLDLSLNTALTSLRCSANQLTNLVLTNNTALASLYCAGNQLTTLDLSSNLALTTLRCGANLLTDLNLSSHTALIDLVCSGNQLTSLNIKNGNNVNIINQNFTNNPNLSCVEVDDMTYAYTNFTNKDATTSYSTNCAFCYVYIPDANFKAYLVGNALINTDLDTEILCSEAAAVTGLLDCSNLAIMDLTGIAAFMNISDLNCSFNQLSSLDVSSNAGLAGLNCSNNQLFSLDVSFNSALMMLDCNTNQIATLNMSSNGALTDLNCSSNQLLDLNMTANTALVALDCSANQLASLNIKNGNNVNITSHDFTNNPALACIEVDDAAYANANFTNKDASAAYSTSCPNSCYTNIPDANFKAYLVGNTLLNTNLDGEIQCSEAANFTGQINCSNLAITDLTGIEAFVALTDLRCNNNQLTSIDLSSNTALTVLRCNLNQLTSLDVSFNTALTSLYCNGNQLTSLDVSNNVALSDLRCATNFLTSLDVSNNAALTILRCATNSITDLDASSNVALVDFVCNANQLVSLNIQNGNNVNMTNHNFTNNPALTCIQADDTTFANANLINKDSVAFYSLNCSFVGITTIAAPAQVNIYPNPATSILTIETQEIITNKRIVDINGRLVKMENNAQNNMVINEIPAGIYFLQLTTEKGVYQQKFVKNE